MMNLYIVTSLMFAKDTKHFTFEGRGVGGEAKLFKSYQCYPKLFKPYQSYPNFLNPTKIILYNTV